VNVSQWRYRVVMSIDGHDISEFTGRRTNVITWIRERKRLAS